MTYDRTPFGTRLRDARARVGLTQKEAAERAGIAQSTLAGLEKGGNASGHTPQLAALYEVDAHWLATGEHLLNESSTTTQAWATDRHTSPRMQSQAQDVHKMRAPAHVAEAPLISWESLKVASLPDLFQVLLKDDAMAPFLRAGHTASFSKSLTPRPGDVVLVSDASGQMYVRSYVQRRPGAWVAVATNTAYHALESEADGLQVAAVFAGMKGRLG